MTIRAFIITFIFFILCTLFLFTFLTYGQLFHTFLVVFKKAVKKGIKNIDFRILSSKMSYHLIVIFSYLMFFWDSFSFKEMFSLKSNVIFSWLSLTLSSILSEIKKSSLKSNVKVSKILEELDAAKSIVGNTKLLSYKILIEIMPQITWINPGLKTKINKYKKIMNDYWKEKMVLKLLKVHIAHKR